MTLAFEIVASASVIVAANVSILFVRLSPERVADKFTRITNYVSAL